MASLIVFPASAADSSAGIEFFEKKIRPVLVEHCYKCHSVDAEKIKSGLTVDSRESLLKGGDHGPSIVPGQPDKSLLLRAVKFLEKDLQMPPKQKLDPQIIADLETWIAMGAPDPRAVRTVTKKADASSIDFAAAKKFWSFQPLTDPAPPKGSSASAIDRFLAPKLAEKKITPNGQADNRTLIRRATYDLTGLPPTPEEVHAFLADGSPRAFEKVIDRLLASPHYGEQWGRHWLDLVRYGDTSGCSADFPVPSAHRYRNYVILSFNQDKPYDQFVREQIAGDLLPSRDETERLDHIVATGYLATARRFGNRPAEFHLTIDDVIDNVGKVTLGLSLGCARCHDHKFDPVPATDYFALYGIFDSTRFAFPGTGDYRRPKDFIPLADKTASAQYTAAKAELIAIDTEITKLANEKRAIEQGFNPLDEKAERPTHTLAEIAALTEQLKSRIKPLEIKTQPTEVAYAVGEGTPGNSKLQKKGDPRMLGDEVPRGFLQVLGGQRLPASTKGSGRLELANWLTARDNPLFARVMANRIWQYHFGRGLVSTPNDFGTRGQPPSHPELLDYLASRFIESGWSVKQMHKQVMLTDAYQRSSAENTAYAQLDADDTLLWRFQPRRLTAEEIRDSILAVSGGLDRAMPGAHPFPPENDWKYTEHKPYVAVFETPHRSVYLMQQRIKKHPFLQVFDGADSNATTADRPVSTTPLQALFLMNDPFTHAQAEKLGGRISDVNGDVTARVRYAFELVYGRPATDQEVNDAATFIREAQAALASTGNGENITQPAWAGFARVLFGSNELLHLD